MVKYSYEAGFKSLAKTTTSGLRQQSSVVCDDVVADDTDTEPPFSRFFLLGEPNCFRLVEWGDVSGTAKGPTPAIRSATTMRLESVLLSMYWVNRLCSPANRLFQYTFR